MIEVGIGLNGLQNPVGQMQDPFAIDLHHRMHDCQPPQSDRIDLALFYATGDRTWVQSAIAPT